jgi:SAM-dependent methyltransferase
LIVLFGAMAVWAGLGVLTGVALVGCGVVVHQTLANTPHSLYPFLMPLLLMNIAAMMLASGLIRAGGWRSAAAASAALGVLASFSTNMRTSYLPIYVAMLAVVLFAPWSGWSARRVMRTAMAIGVYAVAFASFQYVAIDRHLPPVNNFNASYHTVAHPLVLSLAVPPSDLSRREGIEWSDGAGIAIAQRIIPNVGYLSPAYDTALFQYYVHLWRAFPGEMIALYVAKFSLAGTPIVDSFEGWTGIEGRVFRILVWPFFLVRNGILLLLVFAMIAVFAVHASARRGSRVALCAGLLSFAAALLLIESAVIMPFYRLQYHGFLTAVFPMVSVLALQSAIDRVFGRRTAISDSSSQAARKTAMYFDAIHGDFASRMNPFDLDARLAWFGRAFNRFPLGSRVLDVGAGLGHFSDLASSREARVVPLDIAPRLVARLHAQHSMAVCGSAIELPFSDGTFDAVISSECIEHTPDPALAVAECLRVLKPGGRLYLTTPNLVWRWSISVAEWLRVRKFEGIENWLSRPALRRAVERCGGSVESSEGLHILPFQLRPLWPLIDWFNLHGQWSRAIMINQCWIVRK